MNCQRCEQPLQPGEAFCGQCGTPSLALPSFVEQPNHLFPPQSGNLPGAELYSQSMHANPLPPRRISAPRFLSQPGIPEQYSPAVYVHHSGNAGAQPPPFYADTTVAIAPQTNSMVQNSPIRPPQQELPGVAQHGFAMPQAHEAPYSMSPISSAGNAHTAHAGPFRAEPADPSSLPLSPSLPPRKQYHGTIIVVAICAIAVIISTIGLIASTFPRGSTTNAQAGTPSSIPATTAQQSTPKSVSTPEMTPTPIARAHPDEGFAWCDTICTSYGFTTEYPAGWAQTATARSKGVHFSNPDQADQIAILSNLGLTTSSASDILNEELQRAFGDKPDYTAPSDTSTSTIGGETWVSAQITYQDDAQQDGRIAAFVTVHRGIAYMIAFQALEPDKQQFNMIYSTYYTPMLNQFRFAQ